MSDLNLASLPHVHEKVFEVFTPENRLSHRTVYVQTETAMVSLYCWDGQFSGLAAHGTEELRLPFACADNDCWPQARYGRRRVESAWVIGRQREEAAV